MKGGLSMVRLDDSSPVFNDEEEFRKSFPAITSN